MASVPTLKDLADTATKIAKATTPMNRNHPNGCDASMSYEHAREVWRLWWAKYNQEKDLGR
jgi:hypothetical protein